MKFQEDTTAAFEKILEEKDFTLLHGLVRHIYIPLDVRQPIQERFIADEIKLTNEQKQITRKTEATLQEATARVEYESQRIGAETEKLEAEKIARAAAPPRRRGPKPCRSRQPSTGAWPRSSASHHSQGRGGSVGEEAARASPCSEAAAGRFSLRRPESYNQWVFATGLPEDLRLHLLYAGDGTFWTDLKGFSDTLLGRQQQLQTHATQPGP